MSFGDTADLPERQRIRSDVALRRLCVQLFAFSWIGALSTALHYLTLGLLVEGFSANPVVASCAGYCGLALLNYYLNYRYTFKSDVPHTTALPRFMVVAGTGFLLNAGLMLLLASIFRLNYWLAQVIATGTVFLWNFCGSLHWSFRKESN